MLCFVRKTLTKVFSLICLTMMAKILSSWRRSPIVDRCAIPLASQILPALLHIGLVAEAYYS